MAFLWWGSDLPGPVTRAAPRAARTEGNPGREELEPYFTEEPEPREAAPWQVRLFLIMSAALAAEIIVIALLANRWI
jgi:hypothetical protein